MGTDGDVRRLKGNKERQEKAEVVCGNVNDGIKKRRKREKELESGAVAVSPGGSVGKVKRKKVMSEKKMRLVEGVVGALGEETSGVDKSKTGDEIVNGLDQVEDASNSSRKNKKKKKNRNLNSSNQVQQLQHEVVEAIEDDVLYMSSGDEDSSTGMRKWLTEHRDQRPGFQLLQQRIDDFIVAHEERLEQERIEREARIAEDGWTVVEHHKGRKKTTDTESGIAVGSVAQAAVLDKMAKKKQKGVGPDFYRFQKREAQRNQVIMLQSKFEEDKKRIQQLRAARKFRPY